VSFDWLGDVLSRDRCAGCDGGVAGRHQVFCGGCSVSVERCASPAGGVVAFGHYGGALAEAVHRFKYREAVHLARPLGHLVRAACRAAGLVVDLVIPVPLHRAKLLARGYNQAALLGAHVAVELGVPLRTRVLIRTADTRPQAELDRAERLRNVAGAFEVRAPRVVQGRRVALVDDVSTTGSTLSACCAALADAGAASVVDVVLARTLRAM
jgi:ComF family protein